MHKFIFGIFNNSKLIHQIGMPVKCTHKQAALIVGILDMAKHVLNKGDYFAADYKH